MKQVSVVLKEKIKTILMNAKGIKEMCSGNTETFLSEYLMSELKKIVLADMNEKNPDEIFDSYYEFFLDINIKNKIIEKGETFYRARVGYVELEGADDDCDRIFKVPFFKKDIEAPPPIITRCARFNNGGTSFLYLADNELTCVAEVQAQVGHICSIGEFICEKDSKFIDLIDSELLDEFGIWKVLLTMPVTKEESYLYNVTSFIASVLKKINGNGIIYPSTQMDGNNVICFNKSLFSLKKYSERTKIVSKVNYEICDWKNDVEFYAESNGSHYINDLNSKKEEKRKNDIEYLEQWIEYKRGKH